MNVNELLKEETLGAMISYSEQHKKSSCAIVKLLVAILRQAKRDGDTDFLKSEICRAYLTMIKRGIM